MVLPEGTGRHGEGRSTNRGALFVGAVLLVAFGFVVLGGLTSPDGPTAAVETTATTLDPTTTTTDRLMPPIDLENFSVEQLETGPQFEWQQAAIDDTDGYPINLLDHEDHLYLFAVSQPDWQSSKGGLLAWRSSNGITWESLGQVIGDDHRVSQVQSTPMGLVAAGTTLDRSHIVVWTSSDGHNWASDEIPVDTGHPQIYPHVTAVGASQDALVVMTSFEFDGQAILEQRLAEAGYEIDLELMSGWETMYRGENGMALRIMAPLGLAGIEIPVDELELTDEEKQWVQAGYHTTSEVRTFARPVGATEWAMGRIEGAQWVGSVVSDVGGTMLLTGWSGSGPIVLRSSDGIEWTEASIDLPSSNMVYPWRDGLVTIADSPRPELLYRESSGSDWERLGLLDHFPVQVQWNVSALDIGQGGIVVAMQGYRTTGVQQSPDPVDPFETVTDEGHTLTLDLARGEISIEADGETHTWATHPSSTPEGVSVDMAARTITLSNPQTGEPLTVLSFEAVREAEADYSEVYFMPDEHVAIAFTKEGSKWSIQSTSSAFGTSSSIARFVVGSDRISAVTVPRDQRFAPYADYDFEFDVWTAEIP